MHENTKMSLHSHGINYPKGSHQQEVTGYWGRDGNDMWFVNRIGNSENPRFHHGDIITLSHALTGCNLHSHHIVSPVSKQQEVSAYCGRDSNDYWRLDTMGQKYWSSGNRFRLFHVNTGFSLHSHNLRLPFGSHQQEVTAYKGRDSNDYWRVQQFEHRAPISSSADPVVRGGDLLTLVQHENTQMSLHSHGINYPNGSHQQEVTGYWGRDSNDFWYINHKNKANHGPFTNGAIVTLTHKNTNHNLHSHHITSPVAKQQEVSAYKGRDSNDFWRVDTMGKPNLARNNRFRLFHVNTGLSLHSHALRLPFGSHQQEVTAYNRRDSNDFWRIRTSTRTHAPVPVPPKTFKVTGTLIDASTGKPITSHSTVTFTLGKKRVTAKVVNGYYSITLTNGHWSRTANAQGYTIDVRTVLVNGVDLHSSLPLSKKTTGWRIVLTWNGARVKDLDGFLEFDNGKAIHYQSQNVSVGNGTAHLDLDSRDGSLPETITIKHMSQGSAKFRVNNYSHEHDIGTSDARVMIYKNGKQMGVFKVLRSLKDDDWNVFTINFKNNKITRQ
jgi:hypothetical protein